MRKLMMMCFLSALWLNVFSLDAPPDLNAPNGKKGIESTDTTIVKASTPIVSNYSDAETPGEKLDVIYFEILERQISDYIELEAEKTNLEEENRKLKQGTKYKRLEDLQAENDRLSSESKRLTITINEKTDVISILEGYKTENLELQSSEKNLVDNEIKEIFKHEELMSEDLLNFTKNRAIRYQVDQKVISKLSAFMEFSKIVIQAQSLLSNRVNSEELEAQLIILENIKNNEFDFLVIKINSLYKVTVKTDDGFEVFAATKELVKVEMNTDIASAYGNNFYKKDSDNKSSDSFKRDKSATVIKIDLHIELLTKNYHYLDNFEIVQVQLNECHQRIEKALNSNCQKLIIVHGIGTGTLKAEVHKLLRNYNLRFYLAKDSGATEVML